MPEYNGVDVQHPSIVAAVKNLDKQGRSTEEIMRIVGVPKEVVDMHKEKK